MNSARRFAFVETWALLGFLVGLVLAGAGCEVFDPNLYRGQDAGLAADGGAAAELRVERR